MNGSVHSIIKTEIGMGVLVAQLAKASAMKAASLGQIQPETIVACQPSFFFLSQSTLSAALSYKNKAK